ncbi:MAG: aminotransferase class V-fold PLP-dependent enzyme [Amphritea sp.]|nr:aminotransferase class V-fold PLP-dependent enzyme [Amphritea sp.]
MSNIFPEIDPQGLMEYSVVYTDRSLNHMSAEFQTVMHDVSSTLQQVYNANAAIVVPGSGTFGMEAVARQFARDKKCLVVRNGWFSFRWSQIFEMGEIPSACTVMKAQRISDEHQSPFTPAPIEQVVATIREEKPDLVFAPHVETASGMILPDDYIRQLADAVHEVGGMMVLDCIASGTVWVDMQATGVDILISAPQKGWSGSPAFGLVMLAEYALQRIEETTSNSFACDLKKWLQIMQAYENGGHAYHATMPTDALQRFHTVMQETAEYGFDTVKNNQLELGRRVRALLADKGFISVAAPGFEAPGVVVCYTDETNIHNGSRFVAEGMQIAAGVPLQCDEPADYKTFRIGLFGLDKLQNIDRTIANFSAALDKVLA